MTHSLVCVKHKRTQKKNKKTLNYCFFTFSWAIVNLHQHILLKVIYFELNS